MNEKTSMPFGLWPSPFKPEYVAQALRLADVAWDDEGETLVWLEGRSDRGVLVCAGPGDAPRDLTPTQSVRARVGYGGGDFAVAGKHVYFVHEGRLYRQPLSFGRAIPITPQFGQPASPTLSPDHKWVVYVHTYEGVDVLAVVDAEGRQWPSILVGGDDFYMQPCFSPDGTRLAWVSWNHPHMPWERSALKVATLDLNGPGAPRVAEIETPVDKPGVSVFQPLFTPDGRSLLYISDESGWSNLYLYDLEAHTHRQLCDEQVEIGVPAWIQGLRRYALGPDGRRVYYLRNEHGFDRLWVYGLNTGQARAVESPLSEYARLDQIAMSRNGTLAFIASSPTASAQVITYRPGSGGPVRVWRRSSADLVPPAELSTPRPVHWTADDGNEVYGLYYPPADAHFVGEGRPPAIINIHGGPTGQARPGYNPRAQFFATRGYAFLEVNYRGSAGYGKRYIELLRGNWGVVDVQDAIGGAQYLVDAGLADPDRLVIMGGSAGGYTVLRALTEHPGFFKAAVCMYGISNLFTLAADTHKFEAHYLDSLLGPLPQAANVYRERSPIFAAERIVDPVAIFQGDQDRVVPRSQAEEIVASLRRRGVPHEYHLYEGEGHGWRKSETIEAFYTAVDRFLRQYVIFA